MFFKALIKTLGSSYNTFSNIGIDNANPSIVKYFKNEYGANWEVALEHRLYEESVKNDKKAA